MIKWKKGTAALLACLVSAAAVAAFPVGAEGDLSFETLTAVPLR